MSRIDKRKELLNSPNVKKTLITLAIPSIIGMVVNGIYNVVDTIFVGRIGTSAIGAVSVAFPFFMLISALGIAVGMGAASYISRSLGRGEHQEAERTGATAVLMVLLLGSLLAFFGNLFLEPILRLFGATDSIMPYAVDYARVLVLGSPIVMMKMTLNNTMRAEGSAKASMVALILGAGLNIILDPILIFGFNMGIQGAAVATIFSQAMAVVFQVWYYKSGRSYLKLNFRQFKLKKVIVVQIILIGLPIFLTHGLNSVAMALVNNAASPYGDAAVAAMGIVKRVISLALFAIFGFSQGFQPVAGYNYGAGCYDRLWESIKFSLKVSTGFTVAASAAFIIFSTTIISWFSNDPEVLNIGGRALRAYSIPFPLLGFQLIYFSLFQSMGKALPAGILSISRQGLLLIPAVLILPNFLGLQGVILAQPVADGLTIIMTLALAGMINKEIKRELPLQKSAENHIKHSLKTQETLVQEKR